MTGALRDLIRVILDTTDATTPRDIARALLALITDPDAALAEALPVFVQVTLSRDRMLMPDDAAATPAPAGVSRAARIRTDWQARLNTPLRVGDAWKRLADCTAADLRRVSADLRVRAAKSLAKADWYDDLADMLPEGATVAALTAEQVAA